MTTTSTTTTRRWRPCLFPSLASLLLLLVTLAPTGRAFFFALPTSLSSTCQAAAATPSSSSIASSLSSYPWRACSTSTARPTSTRTYAAAAAAAAGGNDEEEDGLPDESDAPEPASTTDTWRSNGQEPPPPPAKHPTQLNLTGLPAKVMGSVFKLKVTSCPPLFRRPWSRQPTSTSFSTAWAYDVKEKLLLTNSHCVMDAVVINVKKPGNSNLFKAEVLGKSDHSDLALLRVPDDGFWEGVEAIRMEPEDVKLGELVTVIGYPRGGEKICLTKGIVSRLHFNGEYLSIQIDAVRTKQGREGGREGREGREGGREGGERKMHLPSTRHVRMSAVIYTHHPSLPPSLRSTRRSTLGTAAGRS